MKIYFTNRKERIIRFTSFLNSQLEHLIHSVSNHLTKYLTFNFLRGSQTKTAMTIILAALVLTFLNASVLANTLVVNNVFDTFDGICTGDYGCSLRDAIAEASNGDTITFSDYFLGDVTIVLILGEIVIDKNLMIDGDIDDDNQADVRISGNNNSRVFSFPTGVIGTLEGLKITDGKAEGSNYGAGVYISDGNIVLIQGCFFSSNNAYASGGAIYNGNGVLFVRASWFSNNSSNDGAAIYNDHGTLDIESSRFDYNLAGNQGGAIYNNLGGLSVIDSSIVDNQANNGGGIFSSNRMTINKCRIIHNYATTNGGAIYCNGITTIRNSSISSNDAISSGGGIFGSGQFTIENSTIYSNYALYYGGGMLIHNSSNLDIRNATFSFNSADAGGGLRINYANGADGEHIYNTIIASNEGGDCYIYDGSLEANTNNLIEDGSCSPDLSGDPMLDYPADNGGDSWTVALLCNSPAVDAGNNAYVPAGMTTDQRGEGFPRILDGDGDGIARVDIGAYELNRSADCPNPSLCGVLHLLIGGNE